MQQRRFYSERCVASEVPSSITAISRIRPWLASGWDVGVGVFLSEDVMTGSRQPSIGCNHDLFLAKEIKVGVTAAGTRIDDGGEVA